MKALSEKQAIEKLCHLKDALRANIVRNYEFRAKSCAVCETPGACCLDAHFVNVRISRLEAAAMRRKLAETGPEMLVRIEKRITKSIADHKLDEALDPMTATYACPLFEPGVGCVVHDVKPAACIVHACYEREADFPPDELLDAAEAAIDRLDARSFGSRQSWRPIPVALKLRIRD
jgi:Fe-S-cluster containining protein